MDWSSKAPGVESIFGLDSSSPIALIVRSGFSKPGISFFTSTDSAQQLGLLNWPRGHVVPAHVHNPLIREIRSTQEVLFVRFGRARLDLYNEDQTYSCSRELLSGDVALLSSGGHGLEMLEDSEIVEVKQGPYMGEQEKTRFWPAGNPHFDHIGDV
jgi:hypothetical protein